MQGGLRCAIAIAALLAVAYWQASGQNFEEVNGHFLRGNGLASILRLPQFVGLGLIPLVDNGVVRRDAWENYYDLVIRQLALERSMPPLDGLMRRDYPAIVAPFDIELKSSAKNSVVVPGEELAVHVVNRSPKALYIELSGTSAEGRKVIMVPGTTKVLPGAMHRYPPEGSLKVRTGLGKELVTLLASDEPLPPAELLRASGMADRAVRLFFAAERGNGRIVLRNDPVRILKRTIEIETK